MLFVRLRRRTALPLKGRETATTASITHYKPYRAKYNDRTSFSRYCHSVLIYG
ncbi:MAG: hypothetical protein Q8O31_08160 [Rhodocyclaceae bacterium]|nr:hypothetical protein [Rhodocyclaceae bacterium]